MKVISKLLMFALILSVFAGCKKDENLPLKDIAGTYEGTIKLSGNSPVTEEVFDNSLIENVSIKIKYISEQQAELSFSYDILNIGSPISATATCNVESTTENYSFNGQGSASVADNTLPLQISGSIDKSGKALISITVPTSLTSILSITFEGQKK